MAVLQTTDHPMGTSRRLLQTSADPVVTSKLRRRMAMARHMVDRLRRSSSSNMAVLHLRLRKRK